MPPAGSTTCAHGRRRPSVPRRDQVLRRLDLGREAQVLPHHEEHPAPAGLGDELRRVARIGGHGLLKEDVLARPERVQRHLRMEIVRERDPRRRRCPAARGASCSRSSPRGRRRPRPPAGRASRTPRRAPATWGGGMQPEAGEVVLADRAGTEDRDLVVGFPARVLHGADERRRAATLAPSGTALANPFGEPRAAAGFTGTASTCGSAAGKPRSSPPSRGCRTRRRRASRGRPGRCKAGSSPGR